MKLLIKIGGTLIDTPEHRLAVAGKLAAAITRGHQTVVVHGGGKQLSHYLKQHGIESEFRGGFRVTPPNKRVIPVDRRLRRSTEIRTAAQ